MKMFKRGNLLGQFPIDLEALREKKVQYFTFGSNQVLQVNIYTPKSTLQPLKQLKASPIHSLSPQVIHSLPQQARVDHQQMRAEN